MNLNLKKRLHLLIKRILNLFWDGKTLGHSYWNGILQKQGFLTDAASLLAAISMLFENDTVLGKTNEGDGSLC